MTVKQRSVMVELLIQEEEAANDGQATGPGSIPY